MNKLSNQQKQQLLLKLSEEETFNQVALHAFNSVDKNKNGTIDIRELQACMVDMSQGLGVSVPDPNEIIDMFVKLDKDRNKTIDFNEFKIFVKMALKKIIQAS